MSASVEILSITNDIRSSLFLGFIALQKPFETRVMKISIDRIG
jgi:hypothetical protein